MCVCVCGGGVIKGGMGGTCLDRVFFHEICHLSVFHPEIMFNL